MAMSSAFQHPLSMALLHLLFLFPLVCSAKSLCLPDERTALLHFKQSFIIKDSASSSPDAYPRTESWNPVDCCSWDGVECDNNTGHVVVLDLGSGYLYGSINSGSALFRLGHLRRLNLADNVFINSEIPSGINNLSRLTFLDLSYSNFSGQVPMELMELSKLELLDLSGNSLMLRKPGLRSLLHKLTNLKQLYLTDVKISSSVPEILAKFFSLTVLILSNCDLRGKFPLGIFELPRLEFLSLQSNQELSGSLPDDIQENHPLSKLSLANTRFIGQLPESVGNFKSLEYFDISHCRFSGKLPFSIGNLTQLEYLDLSYNNFSESIPSSIGNLNQLSTLDFSNNKFSGEIPSSISNLAQLVYLSLATNGLTGRIQSSLRNLTRITFLYLSSNKLDGQIPPWIGNLTELTEIKLHGNNFSGSVPESIFKLRNLELLYLHENHLNGTLKLQSFLELKNLTRLQLSGNHLSFLTNVSSINASTPQKFKLLGLASCNLLEFSSFLRNQDELEFLELADNKIHDRIPNWFWTVGTQTLQYLNLGFNSLTGFNNLPALLPWSSLEVFNLESNMLQGSLPHPQPSVTSYIVSNNSLTGQISSTIFCNLSSLMVLDLSNNNLTGMLPPCLSSLTDSLKVLNLQNNHFIGAIPSTYTKNCGLTMMDLSQNELQGRIPRSITHCSHLEVVILGNNLITDSFPYWFGSLLKLKVLILRSNRLYGVIGKPETESDFSKLQVIDISNNHFRGKFPAEYLNVWNAMKVSEISSNLSVSPYMIANTSSQNKEFLWFGYYNYIVTLAVKGRDLKYESVPDSIVAVDLSSNEFEGKIPEAIGDLKLIRMLNLSNNNLSGKIPSSLREISNLESLDLSRNNLWGEIPPQLAKLSFLVIFNVSYNKLEGSIPQGAQFNTYGNDSYEGNSGLCGYPLSEKCGDSSEPNEDEDEGEDHGIWSVMKFGWEVVLTGFGAGVILGVSIGCHFDAWKYAWFRNVFGRWLVSLIGRA